MDTVVKEVWLDALRSGEYKQTRRTLKDEYGYCCLGVLCDLYGKAHGVDWCGTEFMHCSGLLPDEVRCWAGLLCKDGELKNIILTSQGSAFSLVNLNDSGFTFGQIANIIEVQL